MALVEWQGEISPSMRRWFGLSLGAVIAVISAIFRNSNGWVLPVGLGVACTLAVAYYLTRSWQTTWIRVWQTFTFPFAWLMGHVLLLIVFLAVVTPIALILRCAKYDPLRLRNKASSMWCQRSSRDLSSYFKQH
ncbi:MAG: SxtJ family membrane protein [Pirellulaceae bacterium]